MRRVVGYALAFTVAAGPSLIAVAPVRAATGPLLGCDYTHGSSAGSLGRSDDSDSGAVPLPFAHPIAFYGHSYSSLYVNNNGNVTFGAPQDLYVPLEPQSLTPPTIAPFDADVDTRAAASGTVHYGTTTFAGHAAFCVLWGNVNGGGVGFYKSHADKLNAFQLVLVDRSDRAAGDFDVLFNYKQVQWENGDTDDPAHRTGGTDGCGGTETASAGFSAGDGNAAHEYRLLGSGVAGSFLDGTSMCPLAARAMRHGLPRASFSNVPNDPNSAVGRFIFTITHGMPLLPNLTLGDVPSVVEGDQGVRTYDVPVTLSTTSPESVSFTYSVVQQTGDTAVQDVDFKAVKRQQVAVPTRPNYNGFTATTVFVPFSVYSNTLHQANRTFTVQIDSAIGANIVGPSSQRVTIVDDDPFAGSPHVDVNGALIEEGNQVATVGGANKADIEVSLSGALPKGSTASVDVTLVPGTATPGVDYRALPNGTYKETLTFTGGAGIQDAVVGGGVGIVADLCNEGDETFSVVLSNPHGIHLGPQSSALVTIRDQYDGDTLPANQCG